MTPTETPREATFNLARAAEVAGVSPSTLRRNKDRLRQHGATISENGWQVPLSALVASGLMRRTTPPDQPEQAPRGADAPAEDQVHQRVRELERELLEEQERRRSAEAQVRERERELERVDANLEDVRMALRMLTAGPAPTATSAPETAPQTTPETPEHLESESSTQDHAAPRQSWFRRMFG